MRELRLLFLLFPLSSHAFMFQPTLMYRPVSLPVQRCNGMRIVGRVSRTQHSCFTTAMSMYDDEDFEGFNILWDGHDAFVTEKFQCSSKTIAQHVQKMVASGGVQRARDLVTRFGEEPPATASDRDIALRLLRLTFLSSGLRKILEGEILGVEVVEDEIERAGLVDDNDIPEGMRTDVTRKTARNPNARSTPTLRQLDDEPYDARELQAMTVVELKVLLGEAGLKKSGRKAELISRLRDAGW